MIRLHGDDLFDYQQTATSQMSVTSPRDGISELLLLSREEATNERGVNARGVNSRIRWPINEPVKCAKNLVLVKRHWQLLYFKH